MAVHLGRNTRLGCTLPRWISLVPADFVVLHALLVVRDWFEVALTIPLINGKLDGADFACSVSMFFTDYGPHH
jgi:hypothetical protein